MQNKMALKPVLVSLISFFFIFSMPAVTLSTLITFDTLAPSTSIDGINLGGVTINTLGEGKTRVVNDYGVGYRSSPNSITTFGLNDQGDFLTQLDIEFVFDDVVDFVSFTGGDRGGDPDKFTVDLFDEFGTNIYTFTTPLFGGTTPLDPLVMVDYYTFEASYEGIKRMVVRDAINAGIGIDDLEFSSAPVPEPATLLLFGTGIAGIIAARRRKKSC